MNVLNDILQVLSFALPLFVILKRWRQQKGIEIDHVFLFSFGFIFYLILPITLGSIDFYPKYFRPDWKTIFYDIPSSTWTIYFVYCLLLYLSFVAGDLLSNILWRHHTMKRYEYRANFLTPFLWGAVAVTIFFGYPMTKYFFIGYKQSTQIPALGSLTAAVILLLSIAFLYSTKLYDDAKNSSFWNIIFSKGFLCYFPAVILLVSMGGRIVLISSILMLGVFYSVYFKKLRLLYIIGGFFLIIILSHAVFLFRVSQLGQLRNIINWGEYYGLRNLSIYLFSENFNIIFSLLDFLHKYSIPIVRAPITLLSGFAGLIPSFLLPQKASFVVSFDALGYGVDSPAGGVNSFVSWVVNFGFLGSMAFLFIMSFCLGKLKQNRVAPYSAMYIMASGWIGMMFFRDLQQAVIKTIFEFSILVPFVITVLCATIARFRSARKKIIG